MCKTCVGIKCGEWTKTHRFLSAVWVLLTIRPSAPVYEMSENQTGLTDFQTEIFLNFFTVRNVVAER